MVEDGDLRMAVSSAPSVLLLPCSCPGVTGMSLLLVTVSAALIAGLVARPDSLAWTEDV